MKEQEHKQAAARLVQERTQGQLPGSSRRREVSGLVFDWEFPSLAEPFVVTFIAEVHWGDERNRLRFQIDLTELPEAGQERLLGVLSARHANVDDRSSLLAAIEWLLNISLSQTSPF